MLLNDIAPLTHLRPVGLMTVPPWSEDPETARPYFQHLRRLRDEQQRLHPTLTQLSIGMSNVNSEWTDDGGFVPRATADPAKNPQLVVVNGAQPGQTDYKWADYVKIAKIEPQ